jgi:RNA polymerase sigma factor (sigma-70 family)
MTSIIDKLIINYLYIVPIVAKQFKRKMYNIDYEDLIACGNMGLVKAAKKHNKKEGFKTFANLCIRSEMVNYIRKETGFLTNKTRSKKFDSNRTRFLEEQINEPYIKENRVLVYMIDFLPEREKMVIQALYFDKMKGFEVAEQMGLSSGTISVLHKRALKHLREEGMV